MLSTRTIASILFLVVSLAVPARCLSQGTVVFSNGCAPGAITNGLTGLRAEVGTTFSVGLYFAQDGVTDAAQLVQVGAAIHINVSPGYFDAGVYTAPTRPPGSFGMFQVRVWETSFGSTYEQAVANRIPQSGRLALAGESGIMRVHTGDPTADPPIPPSLLWIFPAVVGAPLKDGFILNVVPEPGSFLLLWFGVASLALHRRRSR